MLKKNWYFKLGLCIRFVVNDVRVVYQIWSCNYKLLMFIAFADKMNKYRIINPNNKEVRDNISRTTGYNSFHLLSNV